MWKKIVVAPQAFKGTYTACEAAHAIATGIHQALPQVKTELVPIADGGDDTLDVLLPKLRGSLSFCQAMDAYGHIRIVEWGICGSVAIIEMAKICGLAMLRNQPKSIMKATTFGLGQVMRCACMQGLEYLWICLGGSATHDAGTGMLQALGAKLLDKEGGQIPLGPEGLLKLSAINLNTIDPQLLEVKIHVACDVSNSLTGTQGSILYAPQKGAQAEEMKPLKCAIDRFLKIAGDPLSLSLKPFTGAAGGTAYSLTQFLNAKLYPGAQRILDWLDFDAKLSDASLLILGEGRLDKQTYFGKAPHAAAVRAKQKGIPTLVLAGSLEAELQPPFDYCYTLEGERVSDLSLLARRVFSNPNSLILTKEV